MADLFLRGLGIQRDLAPLQDWRKVMEAAQSGEVDGCNHFLYASEINRYDDLEVFCGRCRVKITVGRFELWEICKQKDRHHCPSYSKEDAMGVLIDLFESQTTNQVC